MRETVDDVVSSHSRVVSKTQDRSISNPMPYTISITDMIISCYGYRISVAQLAHPTSLSLFDGRYLVPTGARLTLVLAGLAAFSANKARGQTHLSFLVGVGSLFAGVGIRHRWRPTTHRDHCSLVQG